MTKILIEITEIFYNLINSVLVGMTYFGIKGFQFQMYLFLFPSCINSKLKLAKKISERSEVNI